MQLRSCDLCESPAVIHDTVRTANVVKVRHLCRAHGLKVWRDALPASLLNLHAIPKDPVFQSLTAQPGKLHRRGDAQPPK